MIIREPSLSDAASTVVRSSKRRPRIVQASTNRATPRITLNASVRNFTDVDSDRMKNAITTSATTDTSDTTDFVITLTRRAFAAAIMQAGEADGDAARGTPSPGSPAW